MRRPPKIELSQKWLTGAMDMHAKFTARADAIFLKSHPAKWGIEGAEKMHNCIRAYTLNEWGEIEKLLVSSLLVGVSVWE